MTRNSDGAVYVRFLSERVGLKLACRRTGEAQIRFGKLIRSESLDGLTDSRRLLSYAEERTLRGMGEKKGSFCRL